jgi:hypothetical protein
MKIATYEATVENGQIKLSEAVRLPEHARLYVVVAGVEDSSRPFVGSPRLKAPEKIQDFTKEIIEEGTDASLQ